MRYGHFDSLNREYVIERPDTPVSWINYMGFKDYCSIISNNASGYSYYKDSVRNRLLRMRFNSIPMDRPGRYLYIRDNDTDEYWSVPWQPVGKDLAKFKTECRHGLGYTRITSEYSDIKASALYFVPLDDPLEIWDLEIVNKGTGPRNLSVFSYAEFCFWKADQELNLQYILYTARPSCPDGIIEYHTRFNPVDQRHAYMFTTGDVASFDTNREAFIGGYRSESDPVAVEKGRCSDSVNPGWNTCAAFHVDVKLAAGDSKRLSYLLGIGPAKTEGKKMREKYSKPGIVDGAFNSLKKFWADRLATFSCETPDDGLNNMVNAWNAYQCNVNFRWSRFASFIEVGGREGLGFRDSSQDTFAVNHQSAHETKSRLVELLQGQYASGAAVHTLTPLMRPGHETQPATGNLCSDDHLWIVLAVSAYVKETGDRKFLGTKVKYLDKGSDTVYTHLKNAADFTLKHKGRHGLALSLAADWNDCINLGNEKGESVWTSIFLYKVLNELTEIADFLDETKDATKFRRLSDAEKEIVEKVGWDGEWYLRGFRQGKEPVGSYKNPACKIYLEPQSWIPLSGLNTGERGRKCMDSVYKKLFTEYGILLLWPSEATDSAFPAGMKENGAIFCHPNPWAMVSECVLGRGDRAFEYYTALCPATWNDEIEVREGEPYVYSQSIIGKEHMNFGKSRHPWGTGTATWAYVAATNFILGIRPSFDGLLIDPCIPMKWDGFHVRRKFRDAWYDITVKNPGHISKGVKEISVNGEKIKGTVIKPKGRGTENRVTVVMG